MYTERAVDVVHAGLSGEGKEVRVRVLSAMKRRVSLHTLGGREQILCLTQPSESAQFDPALDTSGKLNAERPTTSFT